MNWATRLGNVDPRILYILLFIFVAIPLIRPVGMPTPIEPMTQQAFQALDALQEGDVVVVAMDFSVGYKADLFPGVIAMIQHALDKGARVLMPAVIQDGPLLANEVVDYFKARGYEYGTDLVNLGFLPGGETAVAALARDVLKTFPQDFYGTPIDQLPAMAGVKTAADFALVVAVAVNITPGGVDWIKQVQGPFGTPLVFLSGTMLVPQFTPYLQAGQLVGMLKGISGSAQYETLMSQPGPAVAAMDGQSLAHVLIIVFIILGNIAFFAQSRKGGR